MGTLEDLMRAFVRKKAMQPVDSKGGEKSCSRMVCRAIAEGCRAEGLDYNVYLNQYFEDSRKYSSR